MRDILAKGEEAFLAEIKRRFRQETTRTGVVGIGDDAAVLPGTPARLVSTDMLVEGTHFRWDLTSPLDLAHRAVESNLSDMAAMAAEPEALFLGLAVGADAHERVDALTRALATVARQRGVPFLGGDTTRSPEGCTVLSITVVGRALKGGKPVLRSGGRAGDLLVVSGELGAAKLGLESLEGRVRWPRRRGSRAARDEAHAAYRRPVARLDFTGLLARFARSAIDLSDGLGLDLPRLAASSGCGFEVEEAAIPLHRCLRFWLRGRKDFRRLGTAWALGGGEDYQILFSLSPRLLIAASKYAKRHNLAFYVVGRLTEKKSYRLLPEQSEKRSCRWPRSGWDPFAAHGEKKPAQGLDAPALSDVDPAGRPRIP